MSDEIGFHVLGVDAGGSKTVCLLADQHGQILAESRGGGANVHSAGEREIEVLLRRLTQDVIGGRDIEAAAICLGMAGVDRPQERDYVRRIVEGLGYHCRILVVNDALIALTAGVGDSPGIVVIAGTGSIAYGRNARHEAARAGGWGYVLSDEGSGYWIGRRALRAVVRQADGRGIQTSLTPPVLAHFGISRPQDLIHEVHRRDLRPSAIAGLAIYVQRAFEETDETAVNIIQQAAQELTLSARTVAARLDMLGSGAPIVLAGTIFRALPGLALATVRALGEIAPGSSIEILQRNPAEGAVRLALADVRNGVVVPEYRDG